VGTGRDGGCQAHRQGSRLPGRHGRAPREEDEVRGAQRDCFPALADDLGARERAAAGRGPSPSAGGAAPRRRAPPAPRLVVADTACSDRATLSVSRLPVVTLVSRTADPNCLSRCASRGSSRTARECDLRVRGLRHRLVAAAGARRARPKWADALHLRPETYHGPRRAPSPRGPWVAVYGRILAD
jgi:hypothetical protein